MKSQTNAHASVLERLRWEGALLATYRNVLAMLALAGGLSGCGGVVGPDGEGNGTIGRPPRDTTVTHAQIEYEDEEPDSSSRRIVKPALIEKK